MLRYLVKFVNVYFFYAVVYILYFSSIITFLEQWVFNKEISVEILFAYVIANLSQCVKGDDCLVSVIG
jgi:hypothetical protein